MKTIKYDDQLIITDISCTDIKAKVDAVLRDNNITPPSVLPSYLNCELGYRLLWAVVTYAASDYYKSYECNEYADYAFITAEDFLKEYQVHFEHKGFKGSYSMEGCSDWYGKIENTTDLICYTSNTLVGLHHEFIEAVDNYIETLTEIEKIEKNKKEQTMKRKFKIDRADKRGFYVYDKTNNKYMNTSGEFSPTVGDTAQYFWLTVGEAQAAIDKFAKQAPRIFTDEAIEAWRKVKLTGSISDVVSYFMMNNKTFTRHDVIKGLRELYGPDVEISYDLYRETVIDLVEAQLETQNYVRSNDGTKFVYKSVGIEDEADEEDEDVVTPTPRKKDGGKHTIPASQIRHMGMKPGDKCYFIVYDGGFVFNKNEAAAWKEFEQDCNEPALYETTYTVDKNCNIRLRKNIFKIANMLEDFQEYLIYEDAAE